MIATLFAQCIFFTLFVLLIKDADDAHLPVLEPTLLGHGCVL
jgi:hypothetical protein